MYRKKIKREENRKKERKRRIETKCRAKSAKNKCNGKGGKKYEEETWKKEKRKGDEMK